MGKSSESSGLLGALQWSAEASEAGDVGRVFALSTSRWSASFQKASDVHLSFGKKEPGLGASDIYSR